MARLPVLHEPNSQLRMRSVDVEMTVAPSAEVQILIDDMMQTMLEENGVGIAAPQVDVRQRIIIVQMPSGPEALLNPTIVSRSLRKMDSEEGCLSVPGVFGIVKRHRSVTVEAWNRKGQKISVKAKDFLSTVFQHEIDHLDGVLFIDRVKTYTSHTRM